MTANHAAAEPVVQCVSAADDIGKLRALALDWERTAQRDPDAHIALTFPLLFANARHRLRDENWTCYMVREGQDLVNGLFGFRSRLGRRFWNVPIFRIGTEYISDLLDSSPSGGSAVNQLLERMMADQQGSVLFEFGSLRENAFHLLRGAARDSGIMHSWDANGGAYLFDTEQPLERFRSSLGPRLSRNLRRERKRLAQRWSIGFDAVNTPDPAVNLKSLEKFIAIEAAGWKGRSATAIGCSDWHRDYYRSLIEQLSHTRSFTWFTLTANGHPISMYMCIRNHATVWAPKTAYDESFAHFSPGNELLLRIIEHLIDDPGVKRLHMVTGAHWLANWHPLKEQHFRLRLFNDTLSGKCTFLADRLRRLAAARS